MRLARLRRSGERYAPRYLWLRWQARRDSRVCEAQPLADEELGILNLVMEVQRHDNSTLDAASRRLGLDPNYVFKLFRQAHNL